MHSKFLIKKSDFLAKSHYNYHSNYFLYLILIVSFGLCLNLLNNSAYNKIYTQEIQGIDQPQKSVKSAYTNLLSQTDKSAEILLFEGINLVKKNQLELGLMSMEKSVEKDPNWRDSALYLGFTYLKLTEPDQRDQRESIQISEISVLTKAKNYLEKARDIDPLYAKTHEYLAIVYQKLGDTQNAKFSTQRAQDFAK